MVRLIAPLLLVLASLFAALAAQAPAIAQGNCPQCDLPPHCRGNGGGKPKQRPECVPDDEDDDEDDTPAPPPCVDCEGLPRKCRDPEEFEDLPIQVQRQCRRIAISVESDIDFGRVVLLKRGTGSVMLDLETGRKIIEGDIEDIGGVPITGEVNIIGTPLEAVEIAFPLSVGMRDGTAQQAEVRDFETNLPRFPALDRSGELRFRFTGRLMLDQSTNASGRLRGRVPILVTYLD